MADQVKITIGAVKSPSVNRVFADIRKQSRKLQRELESGRIGGPRRGRGKGPLERDAQRAVRELDIGIRRAAAYLERAGERVSRSLQRAGSRGGGGRRQVDQHQRLQERNQLARESSRRRLVQTFGSRMGYHAMRYASPMGPVASVGARVGREMAQGFGIDMDASRSMQSARSIQFRAQQIANAGYIENDPNNNVRRSSADVLAAVKASRDRVKFFTKDENLGALDQFVTLTGDLSSGIALLDKMAMAAGSTGAALGDMGTVYGELNNLFAKDKSLSATERLEKVDQAARALAGQGRLGAVEIKDFARSIAHLTSTASFYDADAGETVRSLGALTQVARGEGGAKSATEATLAAARFLTTFRTNARRAAAERAGVSVESSPGLLKAPEVLIRDIFEKVGTNQKKYMSIFANIRGEKFVSGLYQRYLTEYTKTDKTMSKADRHKEAMKFMNEALDKFKDASLSAETMAKSIDLLNNTAEAHAVDMQEKYTEVATEFMNEMLPAIKELSPHLVNFAKWLAKIASSDTTKKGLKFAAENPIAAASIGLGGAAAVGLAVGGVQALIQAGVSAAFGRLLGGAAVGAAASGAGAAAGGAASGVAAGVAAGAARFLPMLAQAAALLGSFTIGLTGTLDLLQRWDSTIGSRSLMKPENFLEDASNLIDIKMRAADKDIAKYGYEDGSLGAGALQAWHMLGGGSFSDNAKEELENSGMMMSTDSQQYIEMTKRLTEKLQAASDKQEAVKSSTDKLTEAVIENTKARAGENPNGAD